jgi:hypothetical protein
VATATVTDELWDRFHDVVNMNSRELRDWLGVEATGVGVVPDGGSVAAAPPDVYDDDRELGQRVLAVLGKRRTDLTGDDVETIAQVVIRVERLRSQLPEEPAAGTTHRRHRLMTLGHDPLKP